MSPAPKIAIVGGGPAGCTLARLLLNASIPVTIFEKEVSPDVRSQGGTLDLHNATGLKALRQAGLYKEFLKYARFDGEAFAVADKHLKKYISMGGTTKETSRGRPEIDREQLRRVLLEALPEGVIKWGSRLSRVDDDLAMHFDHGVEKGYDLIVGADGAWSKVRPLVSSAQPVYCGLSGLELTIDEVEKHHPDLHRLVNRGSLFAYSDGKFIGAQQKGDRSLIVHVWSLRDEGWPKTHGPAARSAADVKRSILEDYDGWAAPLLYLTQAANEKDMVARGLYELPVGHRWEHRPGVTLIGDAAHLATPFAGEGVNIAMEDALKLAHVIIAAAAAVEGFPSGSSIDARLRAFEEDMFRRGEAVQARSRGNMVDMFFTAGAPATVIDRFVRRALPPSIAYWMPLWAVRVLLWAVQRFMG